MRNMWLSGVKHLAQIAHGEAQREEINLPSYFSGLWGHWPSDETSQRMMWILIIGPSWNKVVGPVNRPKEGRSASLLCAAAFLLRNAAFSTDTGWASHQGAARQVGIDDRLQIDTGEGNILGMGCCFQIRQQNRMVKRHTERYFDLDLWQEVKLSPIIHLIKAIRQRDPNLHAYFNRHLVLVEKQARLPSHFKITY